MTFVEMLAKLAWFERADAMLRAVAGVQSHKFSINRNGGRSGQQVEDMLKRYGITMWGRGFTSDTLTFRVKREQAKWAEYLMHQAGVGVVGAPVDARNAGYPQRSTFHENTTTTTQRGALDVVAGVIARILG